MLSYLYVNSMLNNKTKEMFNSGHKFYNKKTLMFVFIAIGLNFVLLFICLLFYGLNSVITEKQNTITKQKNLLFKMINHGEELSQEQMKLGLITQINRTNNKEYEKFPDYQRLIIQYINKPETTIDLQDL